MILPIFAYGDAVLRKKAVEITPDYEGLKELIADLQETMHSASGIGLAAPQVGKSIRLFIVDTITALKHIREDADKKDNRFMNEEGIQRIFINAKQVHKNGTPWPYN